MAYSHHVIRVIHAALMGSTAKEVAEGGEVWKEGPGSASTNGAVERTQERGSYVAT